VPEVVCSYVIAANQRSGSTLLCRALAGTGVAGRPEEYFLTGPPEGFPPGWTFWEEGLFARPFGPMSREEYLDLVFELGTTANGVFGVKLMWNNIPWVLDKLHEIPRFAGVERAEAFRRLFPNLHMIRLTRRDRAAQAVSWCRAAQDGVWVVSDWEPAAPGAVPEYRYDIISGMEDLLIEGEVGWPVLCDEIGITPFDVVYEDLADPATYDATVRGVLEHLGVDAGDVTIPPPPTRRQADDVNDDWVRRYQAERRAGR